MNMKLQFLFMATIIALSITAEKCRQLIGEEASSKSSRSRFTFLNCFDMRYGTIACVTKEILKLYFSYIKAISVHKARNEATEESLRAKLSQGQGLEEAIKQAREEGNVAAKKVSRQAKHIMGPIISSGWDLIETLYVGGTLVEGLIRGTGTFIGSFCGGLIGEGKLGWVGFILGSHLGSWVGGRIGLMAYDVGNGVQYLLNIVGKESNPYMGSKDLSL